MKAVKGISEAEFLAQVIDFARLQGWRVAHFRASRTLNGWETAVQGDGKGFPDLFLLKPRSHQVIAAELKVGFNKPTSEQRDWLDAMECCGVPAYLWTPRDWDEIEEVLRGVQS